MVLQQWLLNRKQVYIFQSSELFVEDKYVNNVYALLDNFGYCIYEGGPIST